MPKNNILLPSWNDVNIPQFIVDNIRNNYSNHLINYLVLNRVFRFEIKPQYNYWCRNCDYRKQNVRAYEEYGTCENCGSQDFLSANPIWRMGKDRASNVNEGLVPRILHKMEENYKIYFNQKEIPDNFVEMQWLYGTTTEDVPEDEEKIIYSKAKAKFSHGEEIEAETQSQAVAKAAILCPFLWDELFDWKFGVPKDKGRETHILPLLSMWSKFSGSRNFEF